MLFASIHLNINCKNLHAGYYAKLIGCLSASTPIVKVQYFVVDVEKLEVQFEHQN
jgi:hypothetical protein